LFTLFLQKLIRACGEYIKIYFQYTDPLERYMEGRADMDERQIIDRMLNLQKETDEKNTSRLINLEDILVEMRNALSVSIAASSMLSDILKDKKEKKLLVYPAMIRHNQHKLLKLIENIENITAFERNLLFLEPEPTNINILCRDIMGTVSALLSEISFEFRCRIENPLIMADGVKLEAMLLNLISACIKNMPEGRGVDMVLNESPGYVIITLICAIDGIKTFRPHEGYEEHENTDFISEPGRSAIGIAAARSIARLHGGNLYTGFGENEGVFYSAAIPDRLPDDARIIRGGIYSSDAMGRILTGLADILDYTHYMEPFDES
jgi:signal transduction histidine kinase